ncbi:MAG: hypothetical protein P1U40_09395 [Coxiellaceae bacterium]|nr:hypothetical protein [Coxiellaceae bacterium]
MSRINVIRLIMQEYKVKTAESASSNQYHAVAAEISDSSDEHANPSAGFRQLIDLEVQSLVLKSFEPDTEHLSSEDQLFRNSLDLCRCVLHRSEQLHLPHGHHVDEGFFGKEAPFLSYNGGNTAESLSVFVTHYIRQALCEGESSAYSLLRNLDRVTVTSNLLLYFRSLGANDQLTLFKAVYKPYAETSISKIHSMLVDAVYTGLADIVSSISDDNARVVYLSAMAKICADVNYNGRVDRAVRGELIKINPSLVTDAMFGIMPRPAAAALSRLSLVSPGDTAVAIESEAAKTPTSRLGPPS